MYTWMMQNLITMIVHMDKFNFINFRVIKEENRYLWFSAQNFMIGGLEGVEYIVQIIEIKITCMVVIMRKLIVNFSFQLENATKLIKL